MTDGDIRKDRRPLLEKLEPTSSRQRNRAFHTEAAAWSKTGRDILQRLLDAISDLWNA